VRRLCGLLFVSTATAVCSVFLIFIREPPFRWGLCDCAGWETDSLALALEGERSGAPDGGESMTGFSGENSRLASGSNRDKR
jgi:hypothetical protein